MNDLILMTERSFLYSFKNIKRWKLPLYLDFSGNVPRPKYRDFYCILLTLFEVVIHQAMVAFRFFFNLHDIS